MAAVDGGSTVACRSACAAGLALRNLAAVDVAQRFAVQILGAYAIGQRRSRLRPLILAPAIVLTATALAEVALLHAIARVDVTIRNATAVAGVMVPVHVAVVRIDAVVDVDVVPAIDVDIDVTAAPVDTAPQRVGNADPDAPPDGGADRIPAESPTHRRREEEGRKQRVPPRAEDMDRVEYGHEDDLRIGRGDGDDLRRRGRCRDDDGLRGRRRGFDRYGLLFVGTQVAGIPGLGTQELHGIHDVVRLVEEGITEIADPFGLFAEHGEHLREGDQRLHARIPWLVLHRLDGVVALQAAVGERPVGSLRDILRISGRHQHLRQQRIGKERDRRQHLVKLLDVELGRVRRTYLRRKQQEHCSK